MGSAWYGGLYVGGQVYRSAQERFEVRPPTISYYSGTIREEWSSSDQTSRSRSYDVHAILAKNTAYGLLGLDYVLVRLSPLTGFRSENVSVEGPDPSRTSHSKDVYRVKIPDYTHSLRLGLVRKSYDSWSMDATLTYENTHIDLEQDRTYFYAYTYADVDTVSFTREADTTRRSERTNGDAKAHAFRTNVVWKRRLSDRQSLVLLVGAGYVSFNASEAFAGEDFESDSLAYTYDTLYSERSMTILTDRPSQDGWLASGSLGVGTEWNNERLTVAGAIRSYFRYGRARHPEQGIAVLSFTETSGPEYGPDTTVIDDDTDYHQYDAQLVLPLGIELNLTGHLKLRSGAFASYSWQQFKFDKTTARNKRTTEQITSGYSFGLGYRYDNLVIDLVTEGDLASLSAWRVSLSYRM